MRTEILFNGVVRKTPEYDSMTFSVDRYDNNREAMKKAIADFVSIVLENDNEVRIRCDETDIYVVEYGHDNRLSRDDWGTDRLMWVSSEEQDELWANRESD